MDEKINWHFLLAILLSIYFHLILLTTNSKELAKIIDIVRPKQKVMELELYNYRLKMQILREQLEQNLGLGLDGVSKLPPGIEKTTKIPLQDKELQALLSLIKSILNGLWEREDINVPGRAVVRMELRNGKIVNYFAKEWEGGEDFLFELFNFLQKIQAIQLPVKNKDSIWFESQFEAEPEVEE